MPVLLLDDGTAVAETIAICRYFEGRAARAQLFGRDAREIAVVEMWQRRAEIELMQAVQFAFRMSTRRSPMPRGATGEGMGRGEQGQGAGLPLLLDGELATGAYLAGDPLHGGGTSPPSFAIDFMKVARITAPRNW